MKFHPVSRLFACFCFAALLGFGSANCASKAKSNVIAGAGEASGGDAGEAGQPSVTLCGTPGTLSQCNPISASPCDLAAGETCEYSTARGGFVCRLFPRLAGPAEFCDNKAEFCAPGTTCDTFLHQCSHYCCVDTDCTHGACTPDVLEDGTAQMGVCVDEFAADAGAGGNAGGD